MVEKNIFSSSLVVLQNQHDAPIRTQLHHIGLPCSGGHNCLQIMWSSFDMAVDAGWENGAACGTLWCRSMVVHTSCGEIVYVRVALGF